MLSVDTNHEILILHFREGFSIRKIAKQLKLHRDTVRDRISKYEQFKSLPANNQAHPLSVLNRYLSNPVSYDSSSRIKRVMTAAMEAIIEECLLENEQKKRDGRSKQQLLKKDIHEKLLQAGHQIGYTTVCTAIAVRHQRQQEAFIRQQYAPAASCEFDWAEVKIKIEREYKRFYLAVFTSAYSNYRFALLFQRQDTLAFKEAHISFFKHTQGIYHEVVYDNMRVAIREFVGKHEKHPTEALLQLSGWYQYKWRFCNAAKGNEKGHVERSVEYIRRKVFAFKDSFTSLDDAKQYLQERLTELNNRSEVAGISSPLQKFNEEKPYLYPHAEPLECFNAEHHKVDKYGTVCVATNRYSVPDHLIGKMVVLKITAEHVAIYDDKKLLHTHRRHYGRFSWHIDIDHYLSTFEKKPGAIARSVALKQSPDWLRHAWQEYFFNNARSFIELLQYCKTYEITRAQLKTAIDKTAHISKSNVTGENVMALLGNSTVPVFISSDQIDPIAQASLDNLKEMALMMNN